MMNLNHKQQQAIKAQNAKNIMTGLTKGMVNGYVCPDLHITISKNVDDGFAPERVWCKVCDQVAISMMYLVNQNFSPAIEWFRPTEEETAEVLAGLTEDERISHINWLQRGGLVSRQAVLPPITKAEGS